jgi:2'-5' RNA ligase
VNVTDRPHLTIAAGLKPQQFEAAWSYLAPHTFSSVQQVEELLLLKRPLSGGGSYAPVQRFPLR